MSDFEPYSKVNMGTTLIALKYNGGVIMASDCLTSSGNFIADRSAKKVMEISPSPLKFGSIKVLRCGNASHSQMISRMVFNYLNYHAMELEDNQELKIQTVVTIFKNIMYENKNFLSCAFIISNGKEIWSISSGGAAIKHELMTSNGSGSTYVSGFLNDKQRENMSFFECREIAIKAVALAIHDDGSSGGNIRIVDIKSNGRSSEEIINNREIPNIVEN